MMLSELERKRHTPATLREAALELLPVSDAWVDYPRLSGSILLAKHDAPHLTRALVAHCQKHEEHWWVIIRAARRRTWGTSGTLELSEAGRFWRLGESELVRLLKTPHARWNAASFMALAEHPSALVRAYVAYHPRVPRVVAQELADDPVWFVRLRLLANHHVPKSVTRHLRRR